MSLLVLLATTPLYAVVNPKLQPRHLADRYGSVVACSVTAIDAKARRAELKLEGVSRGDFAAKEITLTAKAEGLAEAVLSLGKGQKIVAYVGTKRARHENDILYYSGRGVWYLATMSAGPGTWEVLSNADKGIEPSSSEIMFGTFNGEVESLWEMMQDTARGVAYFPAVPLERFSAKLVADLRQPLRGVAIYDVNGDGRPDLFACSAAGNRLFIQDEKGEFVDHTAAMGLAATKSASCSFADADGDADLLLDDTLYRQVDGKFVKSGDVPAGPDCLSAAFVEFNGDGYRPCLRQQRSIKPAAAGQAPTASQAPRQQPHETRPDFAFLSARQQSRLRRRCRPRQPLRIATSAPQRDLFLDCPSS